MKCNEVQDLMELYCSGDLDEVTMETMEEHINHCDNCSEYYNELKESINSIREAYSEIELPAELQDLDNLLPKKPRENNYNFRKIASIIAFILVAAVFLNYNTLANTIKKIPYPEWVRLLGGEGIVNSLEKGFGQSVELSESHNGVEMTVHNVILDEKRTNVLFSISGIPVGSHASIDNINIRDGMGRILVKGGSWAVSYNAKEGKVYVNFSGDKISKRVNKLAFEIKGLRILTPAVKELDYQLDGSSDFSKAIVVDSEAYKNIRIKSLENLSNMMIIKYEVEYPKDGFKMHPTPHLSLMSAGKQVSKISSGIGYGTEKNVGLVEEVFDMRNVDSKNLNLTLNYYKAGPYMDNVWKVSFAVDKSSISRSKYEMKINETLEIMDAKLIIEKLEATPTSTSIYMREASMGKVNSGDYNSNMNPDYYNSVRLNRLKLLNNGNTYKGYAISKKEKGKTVFIYEFEPIDVLKDTKLIVDEALVDSSCDEKINLTNIAAEKQKLAYNLDGIPFDIVYYKNNGTLNVEIYNTSSVNRGEFGHMELRDKATDTHRFFAIQRHSFSMNESVTTLTSPDFEGDNAVLYIKSYSKVINPNIEIKVN
jgi:hypothetical protein